MKEWTIHDFLRSAEKSLELGEKLKNYTCKKDLLDRVERLKKMIAERER